MATPVLEDLLERGDRAPNFFLPDQRDVVINLADKARGGPLFVFLFPTQKDPGAMAEFQALLAAAPGMLAAGAHLFAITADPMPLVQRLAEAHKPDFLFSLTMTKRSPLGLAHGASSSDSSSVPISTFAPSCAPVTPPSHRGQRKKSLKWRMSPRSRLLSTRPFWSCPKCSPRISANG